MIRARRGLFNMEQMLVLILSAVFIAASMKKEHNGGLRMVADAGRIQEPPRREQNADQPCDGTEVGRVTNNELNELSGLVESQRFPDVFYSIEDSGNDPVVFVINKNGTLRGQIILDGVKNNDFEDIAISSGTNDDDHYIYVGDIGNDWPGHCQGVDQTHRMVHMFREPDVNEYGNGGKLTMSRNSTTTFILEDQASVCTEESKEDTEAMFIDPISNSGYIIQKVRPRNTRKDPVIFKFDMPSPELVNLDWIWNGVYSSYGMKLELKRVGNIPLVDHNSEMNDYTWPDFITGGDISRDGRQIYLRGYDVVRIFDRDTSIGESVETALIRNQGRDIPLCEEAGQGESIAIQQNGKGFYTVTEAKGEDANTEVDVPITFYALQEGSNVKCRDHWSTSKCEKKRNRDKCNKKRVANKCKKTCEMCSTNDSETTTNTTAAQCVSDSDCPGAKICIAIPLGNPFGGYCRDSCRGREYNEDCPAGQRCNILPCFDCHIVPDHGYCL